MQRITIWLAAGICLLANGLPAVAAAVGGTAALRARAEAFAGGAVLLDPRIVVPDCPDDIAVGWRDSGGRALLAACGPTGWRMVVPVASGRGGQSAAVVKRGDPVSVRIAGAGFAVRLEAVAEGEGRPGGRVMVRNLRSGERVAANVGQDGQLSLAGRGAAE